MAGVTDRRVHQTIEVRGAHPQRPERGRDTDVGAELLEPGDEALGVLALGRGGVRQVREALGGDVAVEAHGERDHHAVGETVVEVANRRQRVGERVRDAEPLLESDASHHRGVEHATAGFHVSQVVAHAALAGFEAPREVDCRLQALRHQTHAFERYPVAERLKTASQVRLDEVRERVHARRGRHGRRQLERELGIR